MATKLTAPQEKVLHYIASHEKRDWKSSPYPEVRRRRGATLVGTPKASLQVVVRLEGLGLVRTWAVNGEAPNPRRRWGKVTPKGRRNLEGTL
jgi:hypothetical protein